MVERRPYKAKVYGSSPYGPIEPPSNQSKIGRVTGTLFRHDEGLLLLCSTIKIFFYLK